MPNKAFLGLDVLDPVKRESTHVTMLICVNTVPTKDISAGDLSSDTLEGKGSHIPPQLHKLQLAGMKIHVICSLVLVPEPKSQL